MLSPWSSKATSAVRKADKPQPLDPPVQLAVRGVRWPTIRKAVDWLTEQDIVTEQNAQRIVNRSRGEADVIGAEAAKLLNKRIRDALVESARVGESGEDWKKRAAGIVDMQRGLDETIHRTFTHRAYHAGQRQVIDEHPEVAAQFPYLLYQATHDTRVRDEHAALDGKVAHVDSPLAKRFRAAIDDWNCRCSLVPMTRSDALQQGIDDDTGWVEPSAVEPIAETPELGPSRASVWVTADHDLLGQRSQSMLGRSLDHDEYASLAGAPHASRVAVEESSKGIRLRAGGGGIQSMTADLRPNIETNRPELRIEWIQASGERKAVGAEVLARQAEFARRNGISEITMDAAGGEGSAFNGYYTWPRLGVDGPIPEALRSQLPADLSGAQTVLDLFETEAGRQWWRENGTAFFGRFDPSDGSRSMQVLTAYLRLKGLIR